MATSNLEIIVGLRDQASGPLGGLRRMLGGIGQVAGGILGAQAIGGLINGVKNLASEGLQAVASYELLSSSMTSLVARELRAADSTLTMEDALAAAGPKAQDLVKWIEQLAIKSPFDQKGVADAMRTAMAYGFNVEQAQALTKASIDFVAGTGGTSAQMNQIALALGQMSAKGKLAGQEVLQLTNAGVGVRGILDKMGFSLDDVSKGLVKSDDFFKAFIDTMDDEFGGAAERQANSWSGLLNTLSDVKQIGLREFFTGIFKSVQPLVVSFADWLQGPGLERLRSWGESAGLLASKFVNLFQVIADAGLGAPETSEAFGWILGPSLMSKLQELQTKFAPIITAVQGLLAAFQASGPAIVAAVQDIWTSISGTISEQGPGIIANVTSIINSIRDFWTAHGAEIIAITAGIIKFLGLVFIGGFQFISGLVAGFLKIIGGDWEGGWQIIVTATETFANSIMKMMGTTLEQVRATWAKNLEMLITIVILLWKRVFDAGRRIVDGLKAGITSAWSGLVSWFQGKIDALVNLLHNALDMHSPSGVFEDIGKNMMLGMAKGIDGAMSAPRAALAGSIGGGGQGSGGSGGLYIGTQNITIMNGSDADEILETITKANQQSMRTAGSFGYAG